MTIGPPLVKDDAPSEVDPKAYSPMLPKRQRELAKPTHDVDVGGSSGLLAMIGSAFLFSVMALLVKLLPGFGTFELVFWRSVFMSVGSLGMLTLHGINPLGKPGTYGLLLLRGLAGFGFMGGFYYAIKVLPLSDAVVITYTSPMITAVAAAVILKEAWQAIDAAGSLLCMAGVVMVSKPSFVMSFFGAQAAALPANGVSAAVLAALLSSSVYILLRYGKDLHPIVSVNYFAVVGIVLSPVFSFLFGEKWVQPQGGEWLLLLLLAWLSIAGQALMNIGLARESAGKATAMNYIQVVFAYTFQVFLLHEDSDALSVLGATLIASWGAVALIKDARQKENALTTSDSAVAAEDLEDGTTREPGALPRLLCRSASALRRSVSDIMIDGPMPDEVDAIKTRVSFSH